jgi:hypothetical protein
LAVLSANSSAHILGSDGGAAGERTTSETQKHEVANALADNGDTGVTQAKA